MPSLGPMEIPTPLNSKEKGQDVDVNDIDKRDIGTPDEWIPRHPDMVRLTGRHPFNVEPPLPKLMDHGFITPAAVHYVRNHGAVPKIKWEEHTLSVGGLVNKPTTFTMDDLLAMPARELPITLVCAGNRRKEENLVAQTIGFNWGAAGVSTSVWKGVLLRDVLLKCGVKTPNEGANHVCFVGVEKMLNLAVCARIIEIVERNWVRVVVIGEVVKPYHVPFFFALGFMMSISVDLPFLSINAKYIGIEPVEHNAIS